MFKKYIIIVLLTILSVRPAYYVGSVLYYQTHVNKIVEKYCVNKNKPLLQCNGKCHLAKQLNTVTDDETSKALTNISVAFFPVYFQTIQKTNLFQIYFKQINLFDSNQITYQYLLNKAIHKPPIV